MRLLGVAVLLSVGVGCTKPCVSKIGVESKPSGARIFMRTDADVTFSPVYGLMGTKQDKTAATPDNTHFSWRDENIKRIWFKVIWEDETESDAIGLARCEHARLVFSKTAAPQKQRIRIKEDEEDARGPDQQRQVALTVNAGACDVVH